MKGRESGMPQEAYWSTFFEPEGVLQVLWPHAERDGPLVEFGSGFGTFTLPAARLTRYEVTALDIEPALVSLVRERAHAEGLTHLRVEQRDFVDNGTGLASGSQAHVMIYNLLHVEAPLDLLREACRVLRPHGTLSVMHWRSDIDTPRGPPLDIRPTPKACARWMAAVGLEQVTPVDLKASAPFHFGLIATKSVEVDRRGDRPETV